MRGFIASSWDLLHPGHLYTLRECRKRCDLLIVGLHIGGRNKKLVETVFERWSRLQQVSFIHEIVPYETEGDLENILHTCNIDIRFLGEDYKTRKDITGKHIVPIEYIPRRHSWSSTELKERIKKS